MVLRSLPMRYRMSEHYFNLQGRINTLVSFGLVLLLSAGGMWGTGRLLVRPSKVTQQEVVSVSLPKPKTAPPSQNKQEEVSEAPILSPSTPVADPPKKPSSTSKGPKPGTYYLQIGAYTEEARAWRQRHWFNQRYTTSVYVAISPIERSGKYKVLVGPFPTRKKALEYGQTHHLEGWPKRLEGLDLQD